MIKRLPRRTIRELEVRYFLEPSLKDLYVEGVGDKSVYEWYLRNAGHKDVSVYEIDSVDVSRVTCEDHGLGGGNRNRVIALSLEFDRKFPRTLSYVRCIADSDFNLIMASQVTGGHLLYTDHTSLDIYAYDKDLIGKILAEKFCIPAIEIEPLFFSMHAILKELFLIRASNEALGWGMALVSFTRCCSLNETTLVLDRTEFVSRCLNSHSKFGNRAQFESSCDRLRSVQVDDDRKIIHAEDFLELLGWCLKKRTGWTEYRAGKRSILSTLLNALEVESLSKEHLFVQLKDIFC